MLPTQPVPAGNRVGVVAYDRGGGMLAADAVGAMGLQVAILAEDTQRALRDLLPSVAAVAGRVSAPPRAVTPGLFRRAPEWSARPGVDAVPGNDGHHRDQ